MNSAGISGEGFVPQVPASDMPDVKTIQENFALKMDVFATDLEQADEFFYGHVAVDSNGSVASRRVGLFYNPNGLNFQNGNLEQNVTHLIDAYYGLSERPAFGDEESEKRKEGLTRFVVADGSIKKYVLKEGKWGSEEVGTPEELKAALDGKLKELEFVRSYRKANSVNGVEVPSVA